jgi:septal ring factor EnvC (AmiA/AmiB activator)
MSGKGMISLYNVLIKMGVDAKEARETVGELDTSTTRTETRVNSVVTAIMAAALIGAYMQLSQMQNTMGRLAQQMETIAATTSATQAGLAATNDRLRSIDDQLRALTEAVNKSTQR